MSNNAVRTKNKKLHKQRHGEVSPSLFCHAFFHFYSIIHYFFDLRSFLLIKKGAFLLPENLYEKSTCKLQVPLFHCLHCFTVLRVLSIKFLFLMKKYEQTNNNDNNNTNNHIKNYCFYIVIVIIFFH